MSTPLDALRLPLEYALKPGVAGRVAGLHHAIAAAARRVESEVPALAGRLAEVVGAVEGFDRLPEAERVSALEKARSLLLALQEGPPTAEPPAHAPPTRRGFASPTSPQRGEATPRLPAREPAREPRRAPADPPGERPRDPLAEPVETLRGVGPKLAATLAEKGIATLADVLRTMPRTYEDRRALRTIDSLDVGDRALVGGVIRMAGPSGWGAQRRWEVQLTDGTGLLRLTYFRFNAAQMARRFPVGARITAAGQVSRFGSQKQMVHPEVTLLGDGEEATPRGILPVYPELDGVPRGRLRSLAQQALEHLAGRIPEILPPGVREQMHLPTMLDALRTIHQPPPDADLEPLVFRDTPAHRRLAFEEFLIMQVAFAQRRRGEARTHALPLGRGQDPAQLITDLFPFPPTGAQSRVVAEILHDLSRDEPMARLLQGDVGSGKTAVAAAACLAAVRAGAQATVVAPTEILAEQHCRNLTRMLTRLGLVTDLITGSLTARERISALARLRQGVTQVAVGTHALLQEDVVFKRLGLAVIDEQHRFGVEQRAALRARGPVVDGTAHVPHLLVMTATPIPRTLALTLYGDLDVSVINEMPPGRQPVRTRVVTPKQRHRVVEALKAAMGRGQQAYVVYPLVEESEKSDLMDATQGADEWRTLLPGASVELLHGRMSSDEKDRAMARFVRGEAAVLVSTTVIEVGVDVPNASMMLVEHAERFGLSQLHQLRGRVGRGRDASECWLMARGKGSEDAQRRLQVMAETQDGFRIAEEDLAIRGPGDLMGTRQAGAPPFLYANLLRHGVLLEEARRHAEALMAADPRLELPDHAPLRHALAERYHHRIELTDAG